MKYLAAIFCTLGLLLAGPAWLWISGEVPVDTPWQEASRHSSGLAPSPEETREAVVQD